MKRILMVAVATAMSAASLHAQASDASKTSKPVPTTTRRPRIGYAAAPPPEQPAQPPARPQFAPPIFIENGNAIVAAPFVVLSDGSILANFGAGYERVLRACAPASQQPTQANVNGRDALGRILPPLGIATLQAGQRGQGFGQLPARNVGACYQIDGQGRVRMNRQ